MCVSRPIANPLCPSQSRPSTGSPAGSPAGSRARSPARSSAGTQSGTPARSSAGTPAGRRSGHRLGHSGTPARSSAGTPAGRRSGHRLGHSSRSLAESENMTERFPGDMSSGDVAAGSSARSLSCDYRVLGHFIVAAGSLLASVSIDSPGRNSELRSPSGGGGGGVSSASRVTPASCA